MCTTCANKARLLAINQVQDVHVRTSTTQLTRLQKSVRVAQLPIDPKYTQWFVRTSLTDSSIIPLYVAGSSGLSSSRRCWNLANAPRDRRVYKRACNVHLSALTGASSWWNSDKMRHLGENVSIFMSNLFQLPSAVRVLPKHRDFTDFPPTHAEGSLNTFMDVHENNIYTASTQVYENALHLTKVHGCRP